MLIQINYEEIKSKHEIIRERYEVMYMAISDHCKKLENPIKIYSEGIAYLFESWDSGPKADFSDIRKRRKPRCCRGYYADFYVASCIQNDSILIYHDKGLDSIQFVGFDPEE